MDDNTGFEASLEDEFVLQLTSELMPFEELLSLPDDIRAVALEVALENILDRIDRHSGCRSSIREPGLAVLQEGLDRSLLLSLTRQKDGFRSIARIRTNDGGIGWLAAKLGRLPHKIDHPLDRLPIAGRVEVGRVVLPLAEIRELAPFDIVLAGGGFNQDLPDVFIRFSDRCVLAATVVQPSKILIQEVSPNERKSPGMPLDKKQTAGQSGPPIEDIPVELVFEIGAIRVPLVELRQLQPGYTLQPDVPIDPGKPVTIRANGVAMGHGEIIRIDNQLGVRILDFDNDLTQ